MKHWARQTFTRQTCSRPAEHAKFVSNYHPARRYEPSHCVLGTGLFFCHVRILRSSYSSCHRLRHWGRVAMPAGRLLSHKEFIPSLCFFFLSSCVTSFHFYIPSFRPRVLCFTSTCTTAGGIHGKVGTCERIPYDDTLGIC